MIMPTNLERHPLSEIFDDMDEATFHQLKESIKKEGLKYQVIVAQDKKNKKKFLIVDGWQRYKALKELMEEEVKIPGFSFNPGHTNNPVAVVIANHLARRRMTPQERARYVRDINKWRMKNDPTSEPPTQREMAEEAGTSVGTMNKVMNEDKPKKPRASKPKQEKPKEDPLPPHKPEHSMERIKREVQESSKRDKLDLLMEENEGLRMQIKDLEAEKADLDEQVGIYTNNGTAEQARELDALEAKQKEMLSLRTKTNNLQAENKKLVKQRDGYKKQLKSAEEKLDVFWEVLSNDKHTADDVYEAMKVVWGKDWRDKK